MVDIAKRIAEAKRLALLEGDNMRFLELDNLLTRITILTENATSALIKGDTAEFMRLELQRSNLIEDFNRKEAA